MTPAPKSSPKPASGSVGTLRKFGKSERLVTAPALRALRYYPAEDVRTPKKAAKPIRPTKLRPSLVPGAVLILLAGRFRGKRVVLLKHIDRGVLLVSGPFKTNGVPLRRVNARYVIATQTRVDVSGVKKDILAKASDPKYFVLKRPASKSAGDAFFAQAEKTAPAKLSTERISHQKEIDAALLKSIKKVPFLEDLLSSTFSLRKGDRPHEMVF